MADTTLGTAVVRTQLDQSGLRTGFGKARQDTEKFAGDSTKAIQGIGAAFTAVVASQGVRRYLSFLTSSAGMAQQAEAANRLFEKSLQRTNQSVAEGATLVDRLSSRFGVANSVIESSATLLLRQGASLDDIERALTAAGASAAAAGFDISTAFDNVATAVATGRSELLETSGIVTNLGPVTQQYAKALGKTVEELTDQEIIQARVNAIYKETASEIEDVDDILKGLPLSQANWTKEIRTFREDAGSMVKTILVPLVDAGVSVLKFVNDLPEPVKRAGLAMSAAAIGGTALASGIVAIRTALTGFNALGLLSFGPAGWIVLGVTAVAGLVAVLAGRDNSLEGALGKANKSLASGDAASLTGALGKVAEKVDGPVKQSLLDLQGELQRTGEVGVEMADKIKAALNQATIAQAQTMVDMAAAELEALRNTSMVSTNRATPQELEGPLRDRIARFGRADLAESLFFDQANNRFSLPADSRVGQGKFDFEIVEAIQAANRQLVGISNDHAAAVEAAEKRLADAWARLTALTSPTTTTVGGTPGGGGGGGGAPAGTPNDPVSVRISGGFAGVSDPSLIGAGPVTPRKTPAQLLLESVERIAEEGRLRDAADDWSGLQRAALAAADAANDARTSLAPLATALLPGPRPVGDPGITASVPAARALVPPEVQAIVPAARDVTSSLEGITAELGSLTEGSVNQLRGRITALQAAADAADPTVRAGLVALVQMLETELADLIRRTTPVALGITPTASIRPIGVGQEAFNAGYSGFRNRDLDRGDGGLAEARRINQEREAAAARFNDTVVRAGLSFAQSIEQGIRTGDPGAIVTGGIGAAGSIAAGLVSNPFGPVFNPILGTIITGVLPIITGLFGGLFGGGRRDEEERRRAAENRRSQVSALEFNFIFNQNNQFAGELQQARNQQALREAGLVTFRDLEQLLRRTVLPKLDGLEARVAALSG